MSDSTTHRRDVLRLKLADAAACRRVEPDHARELALEVRITARARGESALEAEALYLLASIAHERNDTDAALEFATEVIDVADPLQPSVTVAWSRHLIGIVHYQSSNYDAALDQCAQALSLYRASGEHVDEPKMLHTIAAIYQSMGDLDRAIDTYETALAVNEPFNRPEVDAMVLGNLARIRGRLGEYVTAVALGRRAVELAREHAPSLLGGVLADLAEAHVGLGDHASAALCFAEARADWEYRALNDKSLGPAEQLSVMVAEGRVALRSGQFEEAIELLMIALDLADRTDQREVELEVHDLLATAFKRAGRLEEALLHRESQFAIHREIFSDAADLRMRTVRAEHDREAQRMRTRQTRSVAVNHDVADRPELAGAPDRVLDDAHHLDAFERLATLAEHRSGSVRRHTFDVGDLAAEIAHAVGRPPEWSERLRLAARLHDIGKVAVPDTLLCKPGPLTLDEYEEVKQHTIVGRRLLSGVSSELFTLAAEVAWSHHEWWDGSGYPNGLSGLAIPVSGRIVAIADVFDSLLTQKAYKQQWSPGEAARHVVSGGGTQFQPELVEAFLQVVRARFPDIDVA